MQGEESFGLGEGDAAVAVVEMQDADLVVGLSDNHRAVRLETWGL